MNNKLKYIKLFEQFICEGINLNNTKHKESLKVAIEKLGYDFEYGDGYRDMEFTLYNGSDLVAEVSLSTIPSSFDIDDYELEGNKRKTDKEFIFVNTIDVSNKFKRQGVYSNLVTVLILWAKSIGLGGVISPAYNYDTEFKRSADADAFWESYFKKNKSTVSKISYQGEDENDEIENLIDYVAQ